MKKHLLTLTVLLLMSLNLLHADSSTCDQFISLDSLSVTQRADFENGIPVMLVNPNTDSGFHMFYFFEKLNVSPILAISVMAEFEEQSKNISSVLQASGTQIGPLEHHVDYEIDSGYALVPNIKFTSLVKTKKLKDGFIQQWTLVKSTGVSKVVYVNGFIRSTEYKGQTFYSYCTYNIPSISLTKELVNKLSKKSLKESMYENKKWIETVGSDKKRSLDVIAKFKKTFNL